MAPCSTISVVANATASNPLLWHWVAQPNGRGTLDILWSCLCTIFLCSWSALCLNVPESKHGHWGFVKHKLRWQLFTIFFPEVVVGMAAEQWESANQSVKEFARLGHPQWTMRHAFFADMGGFHLQSPDPDFPSFPVDSQQLAYLVEHNYVSMPGLDKSDISDKNKADGFARAISLAQIMWFSVQCIGRWIQRVGLSSLELSTIAFIFCTLNIFFFWAHKPLDVENCIVLQTEYRTADILLAAGDRARDPYSRTPLDFVKPPPSRWSLIAPFWFGLGVFVDFGKESFARPIRAFGNNKVRPPEGITPWESTYGIVFELVYFGVHLIFWNFQFPTLVERSLWRAASLTMIGLLVMYLVFLPVGNLLAGPFAKIFMGLEGRTRILEVAEMLPRWAQFAMYGPVIFAYTLARAYVLLEGFVGLRALPLDVYNSVQWSEFVPHY